MEKTPQSNRVHITIFGETNSGKSALFNAITGANTAIVSEISGTTTDPITKSMELLPFGPVVIIDTAGLNDNTILGKSRMKKTKEVMDRTDFALYTVDINNFSEEEYYTLKKELDNRKIPHIVVFTKKDVSDIEKLAQYSMKFENTYIVSVNDIKTIDALKNKISDQLSAITENEQCLIKGVVPSGSVVIMVVPIDSEAPKGRLILPQVQLIRDCLDNGIRCNVTTEEHLEQALNESQKVDLVITDSQVFGLVSKIVPDNIPLTSFSILMARQKGDISTFIYGAEYIKKLQNGDKVLICEACTHTKSHEDIGTIKIPNMLKKITQKDITFDFAYGRDFPENLEEYALIVHCGGCMITQREMRNRIRKAVDNNVPITNYGIALAYGSGILDRCVEIVNKK